MTLKSTHEYKCEYTYQYQHKYTCSYNDKLLPALPAHPSPFRTTIGSTTRMLRTLLHGCPSRWRRSRTRLESSSSWRTRWWWPKEMKHLFILDFFSQSHPWKGESLLDSVRARWRALRGEDRLKILTHVDSTDPAFCKDPSSVVSGLVFKNATDLVLSLLKVTRAEVQCYDAKRGLYRLMRPDNLPDRLFQSCPFLRRQSSMCVATSARSSQTGKKLMTLPPEG